MVLLDSIKRRNLQPELIDRPDAEPLELRGAFRALERINWLSRSTWILWPPIHAAAEASGNSTLTVLDLATGAGDVPLALWRKARRAGIHLRIAGCDQSPHAVEFARERAQTARANISFFRHDVVCDAIPDRHDIVMCSLFLHHLAEPAAVGLLANMARAARRLVLVNDLARGRLGYLLAWTTARVLTRSKMVHVDAPRSVQGAFTLAEARLLADHAGLGGANVRGRWPCRFLLLWQRP